MMRLRWDKVCCVGIALMLVTASVQAVGLGFYISGGATTADWEDDYADEFEVDHDLLECGIIFHTAVAEDRLFNYRLTLGYRQITMSQDGYDNEFKAEGFTMGHTFGFALVRARAVRLWLGPKIGLTYMDDDADWQYFGAGIGPELGLNIHMGPVVTLALAAGYQYSYFSVVEVEDDNYAYYDDDDDNGEYTEGMPYGSLALIFRMGDSY